MGTDRESEEDIEMNEKSFEIGQRVRIIGPTAADTKIHIGKYFVIEEAKGVLWKNGPFQYCVGYSKHGSIHAWPASSLELAEPEYVSDGQMVKIDEHNPQVIAIDELLDRLDAIERRLGSIEKRLQPPETLTIIPGFKIVCHPSNIVKEWDLGSKGHSTATEEFQSFEGVPAPDEPPELHVGNYVEVVGQPFVVSGLPVGTIDRVSYQAPSGWFTLEGSEWYPLRSLRKLSDDEIIAKIGRERKA